MTKIKIRSNPYNREISYLTMDEATGQWVNVRETDERSRLGIFLAMQYPTEIDGVSNQDFLRTALAAKNQTRVGLYDFILKCEKCTEELKMNKELIFPKKKMED